MSRASQSALLFCKNASKSITEFFKSDEGEISSGKFPRLNF